jgi:glutamyl-Q tRNA(Asp) synthetase
MAITGSSPRYIGRFAPSPTGDLHFGSIVAAVASYLQARSRGGRWLIRIEDIDPPREVAGSATAILRDLEAFGMAADEPVLYQSTRFEAYREASKTLIADGHAFWCGCSRSELPPGGIYPGTCRDGLPADKQPRSLRLRVTADPVRFVDAVQGAFEVDLAATAGDFVIRRADSLPAYQLAVVVDDAWQGVTEVVRGADLLDSTARQVYLQRCLGLPTPDYVHVPLVTGADGRKLSKRDASDPVSSRTPEGLLEAALRFLGQPCPRGLSLTDLWAWAESHWAVSKIPAASRYNARLPHRAET